MADQCECELHEKFLQEFADSGKLQVDAGHPIDIMQRENFALSELLNKLRKNIQADQVEEIISNLKQLMEIHSHYGKKEELFMPILYQHGVTGPSQVMWTVDDEIKLEIRTINKKISAENYHDLKDKILSIVQDVDDMIFREEKIFLPLSMKFFTDEEFLMIYQDLSEFGYALIDDIPKWSAGENYIKSQPEKFNKTILADGIIHFDTGAVTFAELEGILKLLPIDITFIDVNGNIKFFTENAP